MADKKKYIQEYLLKHDYTCYQLHEGNKIDEIYNLYKYGKIPSSINKDLYGYYAIYYAINNHEDNAIKFNEYALKHNNNDAGAFNNLINIYDAKNDMDNLEKLYRQSITNGYKTYIGELITIYKSKNEINKVEDIFNLLCNNKQKYEYLVSVSGIENYNFSKEMLDALSNLELKQDAPISLKLMKSIFNTKNYKIKI